MAEEQGDGRSGGSGSNVRAVSRVPRASAVASQANLRGIIKSSVRKKRFSLAPYDDDIVKYNNLRYPPSKIAEILCLEHELDPKLMNRKSVESRLRYLKKNTLRTLAPTNVMTNLAAVDDPTPLCKCFLIFFFIKYFFSGQRAADSLGKTLTDPYEDFDGDKEELVSEVTTSVAVDDVIKAFLRDSGFLYFYEGEFAWHIFIGRSMTAKVKCGDAEVNGVRVFFTPLGPSAKELASCSLVQDHIQELNFLTTEASFFIESPRPLSLDRSSVKKELFPAENPRWLVVTLPWKDSEKSAAVEFEPFLFQ